MTALLASRQTHVWLLIWHQKSLPFLELQTNIKHFICITLLESVGRAAQLL